MSYKKFRWSKDYEAAEEELQRLLALRGAELSRWQLEAYEEQPPVQQPAERRLWCAEGSMKLHLGTQFVSIQPGDAITIEANQLHQLAAGVAGCVCYEARA